MCRLPTWLLAADRSTGETLLAQLNMVGYVPKLQKSLLKFLLKLRLVITDRFGANFRAEHGKLLEDPTWVLLHICCIIHMIQDAQGDMFKLVDFMVSHQIAFALAQRQGGALRTLRDALRKSIQKRLRIFKTDPPADAVAYHEQALNLFLDVAALPSSVSGKQLKIAVHARHQQRKILTVLDNGHINQWHIDHYCVNCCENEEDTRDKFDRSSDLYYFIERNHH